MTVFLCIIYPPTYFIFSCYLSNLISFIFLPITPFLTISQMSSSLSKKNFYSYMYYISSNKFQILSLSFPSNFFHLSTCYSNSNNISNISFFIKETSILICIARTSTEKSQTKQFCKKKILISQLKNFSNFDVFCQENISYT